MSTTEQAPEHTFPHGPEQVHEHHAEHHAGQAVDLTDAVPSPSEALLERLHARLEQEAADRDLVDVAYRVIDSPVGDLLLARTAEGLVRVAFEGQDHHRVLDELADTVGPRVLRSPGQLDDAAIQMEQYFTGRRHSFTLELDFRLAHGFWRNVLGHLADIAWGDRRTYAEVAYATGSPGAVRAVGTACARNPLPLVVPCHRVVRSDGSLGEYAGGPAAKKLLLELEAA